MRLSHTFATLALSSFAIACSDNTGPKGDASGNFSGKVSIQGQTDATIKGSALYAVGGDMPEHIGFAIGLGTDTVSTTTIFFYRAKSELPATNAHTLFDMTGEDDPTDNDFIAAVLVTPEDETKTAICVSKGGTLTISATGNERVKGSFTLDAQCTKLVGGGEYTAKYTGTFNSIKGDVDIDIPDEEEAL